MTKERKCDNCGSIMVPYTGDNPHKINSAFCNKCGVRTQATGGGADAEAEAVAARGNVATASGGGPSNAQAEAGPEVTSTLAGAKPDSGNKDSGTKDAASARI